MPDIVCLAKAIGGGLPCGAIGATEELFGPVVRGEYDMAGTFNGNPLTMAASRACLTEVLTKDAYEQLNRVHQVLAEGCGAAIERYNLPAYVTGLGAKGSVIYSPTRVREYRDSVGIDERITYLAWLFQQNRGRLQVAVVEAGDVDDLGLPHRGRRRGPTWRTSRSSPPRSPPEPRRAPRRSAALADR